jgi:hypothetical protein
MTPAINARLLSQTDDAAARLLVLPERMPGVIATLDGRYISRGVAEVTSGDGGWCARVRHLDRPGLIASMYFAEGMREVVLRLEDGRSAVARITGTSFTAGAQRVCDLRGHAPLA